MVSLSSRVQPSSLQGSLLFFNVFLIPDLTGSAGRVQRVEVLLLEITIVGEKKKAVGPITAVVTSTATDSKHSTNSIHLVL